MNLNPFQNRKVFSAGSTLVIAALLAAAGLFIFNRPETLRKTLRKTSCLDLSDQKATDEVSTSFRRNDASAGFNLRLKPLKLIRNAKVSLEVQNYRQFESKLRDLALQVGYVANAQVNREGSRTHASITLLAEASKFDEALASVKTLGDVEGESLSVEDVTQAYTDLEARQANKRVAANRLREIIQTRTGKLSDVIEAEQSLSQVTEELERMEAQKRGLDGRIAFSTLQLEVTEPAPPPTRPSAWAPLESAVSDSVQTLTGIGIWLVQALILLTPWILIAQSGWWLWRKHQRNAAETGSSKA